MVYCTSDSSNRRYSLYIYIFFLNKNSIPRLFYTLVVKHYPFKPNEISNIGDISKVIFPQIRFIRFIRSGGRIITIPCFSPARKNPAWILGSSFILGTQCFPREPRDKWKILRSIDRSIDHTPLKAAPSLLPVQGWSESPYTIVTTTLTDAT